MLLACAIGETTVTHEEDIMVKTDREHVTRAIKNYKYMTKPVAVR